MDFTRRTLLCLGLAVSLASACGSDEPAPTENPLTKEEARAAAGKGDTYDWCDVFDWYGDGVCDDFCLQPDPDCGTAADECDSDADCPNGYCEHYATCAAIGCPEPPPSQCIVSECGDANSVSDFTVCGPAPESCGVGEVLTIIQSCWTCVDARTCEPVEGSQPEVCGGIAGIQCSDGYTCQYPAGSCNIADMQGICVAAGGFCPAVYDPVCGCDGNTYSNACHATAAGVTVDYDGGCTDDTKTACGGRAGDTCAADEFCSFTETAMCGWGDAQGVCAPRPEACTAHYDPVCGCDGVTYGNACTAASAGASVLHAGECQSHGETACGGRAGDTCAADEFCSFTLTAMCGHADAQGVCAPRPEACIQLYDPVCGCDGQTHGNACMAANAGASVLYEGECVD